MNITTTRPRIAPAWLAAQIIAGLALTAAFAAPTVAAGSACPGGAVTLATANSASDSIGVDDDLELQLNGTTFYVNNDEIASNLDPISFSAQYGDQLRIIASNSTIYGDHEYIESLVLYCDANGNSQVLEPSPTEYFPTGAFGHVFYDKTFTIQFTAGDTTAPTVTILTPADGAAYLLGQVVVADYTCADETGGSGLASCTGDMADGAAIDTSTVGPGSFSVTGTDNQGNASSATHSYSVVYDFTGFFQPIDNQPIFNSAKAGSAIPVKFGLGGNQGLAIFAAGYPKSQSVPCDEQSAVDGIEATVTAGSSSLSYDANSGQYAYIWKTEKSWAGTCRQLVLKLADGTFHRVDFLFR